jgi:transcriptional regulator with XRE-family HTH domain
MTTEPVGPDRVDELIGARVHAAMWRAHVTQTQVARALGVDQGSVSRRLRGRIAWRVTDLIVVADLCGIDVAELMRRHDVLGPTGAVTRGDRAAESRCTPARANRTPLVLIGGGGVAA